MIHEDDFQYDAFISYTTASNSRGFSPDAAIARKLARALESYRFPASLKRKYGKTIPKRLSRVFLDGDEMRASPDLRDELLKALRKSKTLIVICSPRARHSRWVNEEINIFKQVCGHDKIFPLLIEGKPKADPEDTASAFPDPLMEGKKEPGAANLCKNPFKMEKLRLLAAIVDCNYDDLYQRHKERALRRGIVLSAGVAILSILIATSSVLTVINAKRATEANDYNVTSLLGRVSDNVFKPGPHMADIIVSNIIQQLNQMKFEDPAYEAKRLHAVRTAYSASAKLLEELGRNAEKEKMSDYAKRQIIPLTQARVDAWNPASFDHVRIAAASWATTLTNWWRETQVPNFSADPHMERQECEYNLDPKIWDANANIRARDTIDYAEILGECLQVLDVSSAEDQVKARSYLRNGVELFQKVSVTNGLNDFEKDLMTSMIRAIDRLP
jgi:hypothetical protein